MYRQVADLLAEARQVHGRRMRTASGGLRMTDGDEVEAREQRQRRVDRVLGRRLEPLERPRIAAPRDDVERRAAQVDAVDLRLAVRAQPVARVPQAAGPRPGASRPARPAR